MDRRTLRQSRISCLPARAFTIPHEMNTQEQGSNNLMMQDVQCHRTEEAGVTA